MHIEKQAKAHEHVSRPDYSPKDQVVESDAKFQLPGADKAHRMTADEVSKLLPAFTQVKLQPARGARIPSRLMDRLLSNAGVTR
jgi:hypothetical protein